MSEGTTSPERAPPPQRAPSAMRGKRRSAEIKVQPWIFLASLLVCFPSLSIAEKCKGATGDIGLSYNLLDEFGEQTSVARMGGTLNIVCKNYGDEPPVLPEVQETWTPPPLEVGKFKIVIDHENFGKMEDGVFRCFCGDKSEKSSLLEIKQVVLCSPIQDQASPCSKSQLCHAKPDGTRDCKSGADLCFVGQQDPLYPYHLWIPQASSLSSIRYCGALKKAENEESVQVEFDNATPELQTWRSKLLFTSFSPLSPNLSQVSNGACRRRFGLHEYKFSANLIQLI